MTKLSASKEGCHGTIFIREKIKFYTFLQFLKVCKKMKFLGQKDYKTRYKNDPRLPSSPEQKYGEEFKDAGGWTCVTGNKFYTFQKFLKTCKKMKFLDQKDYKTRYKDDSKLPSAPDEKYGGEFKRAGGWACVSGKTTVNYYTFPQFLKACKKMKFTGWEDYQARYKDDPRLPSNPNKKYQGKFKDAGGLACVTGNKFYTFPKFLKVCKKMEFANRLDYKNRYRNNPKLPSAPDAKYGEEFRCAGGWSCIRKKRSKKIN